MHILILYHNLKLFFFVPIVLFNTANTKGKEKAPSH